VDDRGGKRGAGAIVFDSPFETGEYAERSYAPPKTLPTWGQLMARRIFPVPHGLIAATARVHTLCLVTRNVADFARAGIDVVNPWAA